MRCRLVLVSAPVALALLAAQAHALDPLGPVDPTAEEQAAIYALNRARSDPPAYGRKIGVNLDLVVARPPLAVNRSLTGSSRFHAKEMLEAHYFNHTSEVTGDGPNQMAVQNGYDLFGQGLGRDWGAANTIESNARGIVFIPKLTSAIPLLIEDKGVSGAGHRVHLMAIPDQFAQHREIGMGAAHRGTESIYSIHTANVSPTHTFLTGVVYDDKNKNGRFDAGEGRGGVSVIAGEYPTLSFASGGWSILVPAGAYTVTCSGGSFRGTATAKVTVVDANIEVDFRSGLPGAQVSFVNIDPPAVPGPAVSITPVTTQGTAPFFVAFTAQTSSPGTTTFAWNLGEGTLSASPSPSTTYAAGAYAVRLDGTDADGTGQAAAVVVAGTPAGAGAGTTPPASAALTVAAGSLRASRTAEGKDQVKATLTFELPAGLTETEGLALEVVAAGAKETFVLDAKGRATSVAGRTVKLTYKRPAGGAPTGAGVIAKLVIAWTGDYAAALEYAGLRDANEKRTIPNAVPFGVLLGGQAYAGSRAFTVASKLGVSSKAAPAK